jgi:hypothetical protein
MVLLIILMLLLTLIGVIQKVSGNVDAYADNNMFLQY